MLVGSRSQFGQGSRPSQVGCSQPKATAQPGERSFPDELGERGLKEVPRPFFRPARKTHRGLERTSFEDPSKGPPPPLHGLQGAFARLARGLLQSSSWRAWILIPDSSRGGGVPLAVRHPPDLSGPLRPPTREFPQSAARTLRRRDSRIRSRVAGRPLRAPSGPNKGTRALVSGRPSARQPKRPRRAVRALARRGRMARPWRTRRILSRKLRSRGPAPSSSSWLVRGGIGVRVEVSLNLRLFWLHLRKPGKPRERGPAAPRRSRC